MIFKKVTIIGVGLIGGSIGEALKKKGLAGTAIGVGRRSSSIDEAFARGAIDKGTLDVAKGVAGSDLVIIATPVCLIPEIAKKISRFLKRTAWSPMSGARRLRLSGRLSIFCQRASILSVRILWPARRNGASNSRRITCLEVRSS